MSAAQAVQLVRDQPFVIEPEPLLFAYAVARPWNRQHGLALLSMVLHGAVFLLLLTNRPARIAPLKRLQPQAEPFVELFAPEPQEKQEEQPVRYGDSAQSSAQPVFRVAVLAKDTKHVRIAFASDPSGELRGVLERRAGAIGFASPEQDRACSQQNPANNSTAPDCSYEYDVQTPGWKFDRGNHSVRGYFLVVIGQPDPPYVKALRSQYSIPQDYAAYGLLPEQVRGDVDDAIDEELRRTSQLGSRTATSIEITFAVDEPRGFRLKILSTAPAISGQ
jgi:hypothetical protein